MWSTYKSVLRQLYKNVSGAYVYCHDEMDDILIPRCLLYIDDCHLFVFYVCFHVMTGPRVNPVADG